jgi:glyoxylase-like metal-dependent hydrolase (beta-lactamase superfamily II)
MAGDHILDDITPNISLFSYEENPLRDYLQSLDKVFNLDIELALPGHRGFVKDCKKKVQELKNHHQMRVNEVLSELKNNREDAFHIASKITWDMKCDSWELSPMHQKLFASLETIAHLKYLEEEGLIQKEIEEKKLLFSLKE